MDKKIFENYIFNVLYQVLLLITPFITTPYLTRILGAENLAINTSTQNIAQWFILFGMLGVNAYGNREIAKVRENKDNVSTTFFEIYSMQLLSMTVAFLVYFVYITFIDKSFHNIYLLQMISLMSVSFDITWFFYGVEDFKTVSLRNCAVKILGIILIFTFVKGTSDLALFVLINACSGVLGQVMMWTRLKKYVSFKKVKLRNVLSRYKDNFDLFIPQIAISVYSLMNVSMIRFLYPENIAHVVFYDESQRFVKMFLFIITSIGSVMLPRIANTYANGDKETVNKYLNTTLRFALYLSIPLIFGVASVIGNFVPWFMAEEFGCVASMIIYLSPIILFISISDVFGTQYLVPVGKTKQYTTSVIAGASADLIVNLLLIPKLGAYGAIIGTLTAELTVMFVQLIYIKNEIAFDINPKQIIIYVISSVMMYIVSKFVGSLLPQNIFANLCQVAVGVITYLACNFILKDQFQNNILNTALRKLKHVKD